MKTTLIYVVVLILLVVGCTKEEIAPPSSASEDFEILEIQVSQLREQLGENEQKIDDLSKILEQINGDNLYAYDELLTRIHILENLMSHVPNLVSKFGYINAVNVDGTSSLLEVQFADMKQDDGAPNGFVIKENERSTVTLDPNVSFYILEGVKIRNVATIEELKNAVNEYSRLFKIYMVNGEVVMLTEQYIP